MSPEVTMPLHDRMHTLSYEFRASARLVDGIRRVFPDAIKGRLIPVYSSMEVELSEEQFQHEATQAQLVRAKAFFKASTEPLYIKPNVDIYQSSVAMQPYYEPRYQEVVRPLRALGKLSLSFDDAVIGYEAFVDRTFESSPDVELLQQLNRQLADERIRRLYSLTPHDIIVTSKMID